MSEHTKTPWSLFDGGEFIYINEKDGPGFICAVNVVSHQANKCKSNARHIVHCVNNHERMYKALESWMKILDAERLGLVCHSAKIVAEEEAKILFAELESSRD